MKIFVFQPVYNMVAITIHFVFFLRKNKIKSWDSSKYKFKCMWLKHLGALATFMSHKPLIWEDKKLLLPE